MAFSVFPFHLAFSRIDQVFLRGLGELGGNNLFLLFVKALLKSSSVFLSVGRF